jgi:hypothetical protein
MEGRWVIWMYLVMNYFISLRGPRTSEAIEYRVAVKSFELCASDEVIRRPDGGGPPTAARGGRGKFVSITSCLFVLTCNRPQTNSMTR